MRNHYAVVDAEPERRHPIRAGLRPHAMTATRGKGQPEGAVEAGPWQRGRAPAATAGLSECTPGWRSRSVGTGRGRGIGRSGRYQSNNRRAVRGAIAGGGRTGVIGEGTLKLEGEGKLVARIRRHCGGRPLV